MKGTDSYPPAELSDSNSAVNVIDFPENSGDVENSNDINSEGEDARGPEIWDGSEAEIVVDDDAEDYEEETTGIKIKYKLKPDEIKRFISHSVRYEKNKKAQKKHTVLHIAVVVLMIAMGIVTGSILYAWLALFSVAALTLLWIVPFFSIKRLVKDISNEEETEVEIFPDKIEVKGKNQTREIPLDGSCESEELDDMIMLFSNNGMNLIVPLRAVEPEFQADVQAMIFSGAKPRYKD